MSPENALSQRRNALLPILVTLDGIETLASSVHPSKALSFTSEMAPSVETDVRLVHPMKAREPSDSSAEGSVAVFMLEQAENA